MSALDPGQRRVSVHADTTVIDLALPAAVPVATLIPSIVDMLHRNDDHVSDDRAPKRYQLCPLGAPALAASTTLAQNGIRDGAILLLSRHATAPPAPRHDDPADAVGNAVVATIHTAALPGQQRSAQLTAAVAAGLFVTTGGLALIRTAFGSNATRNIGATATAVALIAVLAMSSASVAHRNHQNAVASTTLRLIAAGLAAIAGFLAIPGPPGGPNLLLAAMAAAVTSALAPFMSDRGAVTSTAVACFALVVAAAALTAVLTDASPDAIASVCALASLALLSLAGRVSILLTGLSPQLGPADECLPAKAIRADRWLTSLVAAFASSAAVSAVVTVLAGSVRPDRIACAALTSVLLLLRARHDGRRAVVYIATGIVSAGATFGNTAVRVPDYGLWIALVTVLLAAAAICIGFVTPTMSFSPVVRRGVDLLEWLALMALVPLTCWICGLYEAIRGLSPN